MLNATEILSIIITVGGLGILLNPWTWGKIFVPGHMWREQGLPRALTASEFLLPGMKYAQMAVAPTSWGVDYGWILFSSLHFSALPWFSTANVLLLLYTEKCYLQNPGHLQHNSTQDTSSVYKAEQSPHHQHKHHSIWSRSYSSIIHSFSHLFIHLIT